MDDKKTGSTVQIIVAIIGATAVCIASIIGIFQPMANRWVDNNFPTNTPLANISIESPAPIYIVVTETPSPVFTTMPNMIDTPLPTLTIIETAINSQGISNSSLIAEHYILGYTENDLAARQILAICKEPSCRVIFIKSLDELPNDWYHLTGNVASTKENLPDGCRTKQELINSQVTYMQANNYTPCP